MDDERRLNRCQLGTDKRRLEQVCALPVDDHVVYVRAAECIEAAVDLARSEGILTGGTGGAALHVMRDIAAQHYAEGDRLIALLPDHGSRYVDTQFDEEWLTVRDIFVPAISSEKAGVK